MIYESEEGLIGEGMPKKTKLFFVLTFFALLIASVFVYTMFIGPMRFKVPIDEKFGGILFEVKEGMSTVSIAKELKAFGVIASSEAFSVMAELFGDTKHIKPGIYYFKSPTGAVQAERRIAKGEFGLPQVKLTFPEGFTVKQVAERLEANLAFFDKSEFLGLASTSEGYLFPETYFFMPSDNAKKIYSAMILMFRKQTSELWNGVSTSTKEDLVKMASILQKEVKDPKDMKIVSGILWKRISIGMALQVDSTLDYERNKTSAELTKADLEQDSLFNTYTRRGLPPTPIDNPGIDALRAAMEPTASPYLYFLTDKDGKVYYAKTFEEHKANKARHL